MKHITRSAGTALVGVLLIATMTGTAFASSAPLTRAQGTWRSGREIRPDFAKDPAALEADADLPPAAAGLPGDGENDLSLTGFADGDLIEGFDSWSVGHTGIMDITRTIAWYSNCVWSAVKDGSGCVVLERPIKYRGYDYAYGLWVPAATTYQRTSARRFCSSQLGEPYNLFSSKSDYAQWYCSKLPWAGYVDRAQRDLDVNGGYWVTPADLYNDDETRVFASAN